MTVPTSVAVSLPLSDGQIYRSPQGRHYRVSWAGIEKGYRLEPWSVTRNRVRDNEYIAYGQIPVDWQLVDPQEPAAPGNILRKPDPAWIMRIAQDAAVAWHLGLEDILSKTGKHRHFDVPVRKVFHWLCIEITGCSQLGLALVLGIDRSSVRDGWTTTAARLESSGSSEVLGMLDRFFEVAQRRTEAEVTR
jgi:hypothetical protein